MNKKRRLRVGVIIVLLIGILVFGVKKKQLEEQVRATTLAYLEESYGKAGKYQINAIKSYWSNDEGLNGAMMSQRNLFPRLKGYEVSVETAYFPEEIALFTSTMDGEVEVAYENTLDIIAVQNGIDDIQSYVRDEAYRKYQGLLNATGLKEAKFDMRIESDVRRNYGKLPTMTDLKEAYIIYYVSSVRIRDDFETRDAGIEALKKVAILYFSTLFPLNEDQHKHSIRIGFNGVFKDVAESKQKILKGGYLGLENGELHFDLEGLDKPVTFPNFEQEYLSGEGKE